MAPEFGMVEPSAVMRQAAKGLYQMFVALRAEGFTEAQAMHIVGVAVAASTPRTEGGTSDGP